MAAKQNEGREIRTPNLLIWSQTRCRCAIPPLFIAGAIDSQAKCNWKPLRTCQYLHLGSEQFEPKNNLPGTTFANLLHARCVQGGVTARSILNEKACYQHLGEGMTENGALGENHTFVEVASAKNIPTGNWSQGLSHAKRL